MHAVMENYYSPKSKIPGPKAVTVFDGVDYSGELTNVLPEIDAFFDTYEYHPLQTECRLVDLTKGVAGTADLLMVTNKGEIVIVDWKFCKIKFGSDFINPFQDGPLKGYPGTNYWKYASQLNIYRIMLETIYELPVFDMILVAVDPDTKKVNFYNVPRLLPFNKWYENVRTTVESE